MTDFFYISVIIILGFIIYILIKRIRTIKKQHTVKLAELYRTLSKLTDKTENSYQKVQMDNNINKVISDAKIRLNEDIFDLQMDVFRKITEN